ncbi:MAG: hypothetical protein R3224_06410 [Balneolaceae bacterium]|nr:hypothetical protein [Balneolaceae bacterium]
MRVIRTHIAVLVVAAGLCQALPASGQPGGSYELIPAPDLWYNDVDGVRVGVRVLGQMSGTFEDGPHRLDAGAWFSSWTPELPASYYLSFTEPIFSLSSFGSEANVRLRSTIRTGFSKHGIEFNKRWLTGFDQDHFIRFTVGFGVQKRFDSEYVPFPTLWQEELLWLSEAGVELRNRNGLGPYVLKSGLSANLTGDAPSFASSRSEFQQLAKLGAGFEFRTRLFAGISSNRTVPEFLHARGFLSPAGWMGMGLTRAKGTIPTAWMESGLFQVAGGPNLRGYTETDIEQLNGGEIPLFTSMGSVNTEFDYPNPLDRAIKEIPVIGGVLRFRSYLFFDAGTSLGITETEESRTLSDAGPGFMLSLNIPDYLGNPRGFSVRYDIPLWLSHTDGESHFSYRSVIGIGAVISL